MILLHRGEIEQIVFTASEKAGGRDTASFHFVFKDQLTKKMIEVELANTSLFPGRYDQAEIDVAALFTADDDDGFYYYFIFISGSAPGEPPVENGIMSLASERKEPAAYNPAEFNFETYGQ